MDRPFEVGDWVVCESALYTKGLVTTGLSYRISNSSNLLIQAEWDDGISSVWLPKSWFRLEDPFQTKVRLTRDKLLTTKTNG
ncbi:hypothetical protein CLV58_109107 [Spirosoma oryzae]|uniref:Uncharacterized protein n=1 Tax=Spirosoma oryzae TaxID=1469603 RepID=A0A2T0SYB1_9BACT|nr:hypothetical protein CLV58_109107 [Spirosoma oryzae]